MQTSPPREEEEGSSHHQAGTSHSSVTSSPPGCRQTSWHSLGRLCVKLVTHRGAWKGTVVTQEVASRFSHLHLLP